MQYRFAKLEDAEVLASLNVQLIRDEGHRNATPIPELTERMRCWLDDDYQAVLVEDDGAVIGYALFRRESEHAYLRQLFVSPERRRKGVGRALIDWLWENAWREARRLRIDVLVKNTDAQAFWASIGFKPYCLTLEMDPPHTS